MPRISRSLVVLASTIFLLAACQGPATHRPSPWGLKTIHPQAGRCGHFPRAHGVPPVTVQSAPVPAAAPSGA